MTMHTHAYIRTHAYACTHINQVGDGHYTLYPVPCTLYQVGDDHDQPNVDFEACLAWGHLVEHAAEIG